MKRLIIILVAITGCAQIQSAFDITPANEFPLREEEIDITPADQPPSELSSIFNFGTNQKDQINKAIEFCKDRKKEIETEEERMLQEHLPPSKKPESTVYYDTPEYKNLMEEKENLRLRLDGLEIRQKVRARDTEILKRFRNEYLAVADAIAASRWLITFDDEDKKWLKDNEVKIEEWSLYLDNFKKLPIGPKP